MICSDLKKIECELHLMWALKLFYESSQKSQNSQNPNFSNCQHGFKKY